MYVIIVYDVSVERVSKVCNFLRSYLSWVQNSVFEGEVTDSQLMRIENGLKNIIDENIDSIRIYIMRIKDVMNVKTLGKEKANLDNII
jgi:CRISPR-associated protein, Cas2 family